MSIEMLAILAVVGLVAGFFDAIAGGGGLLTVPAFALAGLDPVAVVATNKLCGCFGTGSSTLAFARAGKIDFSRMWPSAVGAGAGSILGALALPFAPREAANIALPFILVAVALYFALSPQMGDSDRHQRLSERAYSWTLAPLIGFYDGVFGPGAGSFYTIGFVALVGFGVTRAIANARLANFASNVGGLAIYAFGGHIVLAPGLAVGLGQFVGSRLGAKAALGAGVRLVRPLIVIVSCLMALRLATSPTYPLHPWLINLLKPLTSG
jgi:uncharacterized membrane protein YfcA